MPRPLLLPCFVAGGGVSGTTSTSVSGVFACARGGVIGGVISPPSLVSIVELCALLDVTSGVPRRPVGVVIRVPV